jgi:hypothetical protein
MQQLAGESSIVQFSYRVASPDLPPDAYLVRFHGRGLHRDGNASPITTRDHHEVAVHLNAAYPRMMPELSWRTPIFHPNISASGVVCLGGYSTHWVPSLNLDQLCGMLWDMIRYANFDVESPYNREAAMWARTQQTFLLPLDPRPLRDRPATNGTSHRGPVAREQDREVMFLDRPAPQQPPHPPAVPSEIIEAEVVDAEVLDLAEPDIMFIE